jgi:hypothetical protein
VLCYAGAAERGAGEEERRRDEGTGDGAKEVARSAGGKAAGARVNGCDGKVLRCGAGNRHQHTRRQGILGWRMTWQNRSVVYSMCVKKFICRGR